MNTPFNQYLSQGMSNNHINARNDETKMTVGEAAKLLTKKFKSKIYAKELEVFATEWHHAGVYKNRSGRLSGKRIFFLSVEDGIRNNGRNFRESLCCRTKAGSWHATGARIRFVKFERISTNRVVAN